MWWSGPVAGTGWGMPWFMLLFPLLFLLCMILMAYGCMRGRASVWSCNSGRHPADTLQTLVDEVRKLRQEVEELKKEIKK